MRLNSDESSLVQTLEDADESGDEIRSTVTSLSEGVSETSSKISLSRLSDMKDNLVQKATNAMFSKVMKTGKYNILLGECFYLLFLNSFWLNLSNSHLKH